MSYFRHSSNEVSKPKLADFQAGVRGVLRDLGARVGPGGFWIVDSDLGAIHAEIDPRKLKLTVSFADKGRAIEALGSLVDPATGRWVLLFSRWDEPADCVASIREAFRMHFSARRLSS